MYTSIKHNNYYKTIEQGIKRGRKVMDQTISMMPAANRRRPLVKDNVSVTLFFADVIAMSLSFIFAFFSAQTIKEWLQPDVYDKPLYEYAHISDLFFLWFCPVVLFLFFSRGHYTKRVPWWSQVQSVLSICIRILFLDLFTRLALDMSFSRSLIALSWVYAFFFILGGRQIVYQIARKKGIWRIPSIVIGDNETVTNMLYAFATDHYTGYDIKTVCLRDREKDKFSVDAIPMKYANIEINRDPIDIRKYVSEHIDNFFIISMETFRGDDRDKLIGILTELNALYAIVPPTSRISTFDMEPNYFFGYDIMLLNAKKATLSPAGRFIKRTMDIVIASTALLLLLPFMIATAIMLKVEGQGGSIFYGGKRIGRNGKKFSCWKFRSMEPDSDHLLHELLEKDPEAKKEWETYRKLKGPDPRVTTKTARIIRKTSIDELPQLWNVIKGDMSLVGPRPILDDEVELFGESINQYMQLRPGITGLWQVSGRNDTSFQRRVYWDSWYARNWSFWGDLVIMIKTLRVVTGGSGAY